MGHIGADSFNYTVSDGNGGTATANVVITTALANGHLTANADTATTSEDSALVIGVLTNDTDIGGHTLSVIAATNPTHGQVASNGTVVTYTPTPNYNGADSFTYTVSDGQGNTDTATVSITVTPVNDAPKAYNDVATTIETSALNILVLANDTDVDNDTLTVSSVSTASHGTVAITTTGVSYTAGLGYLGTDTFQYTANDGNGGTSTATVTVTIQVSAGHVTCLTDTPTVSEDSVVTITPFTNDVDTGGHALTLDSVSNPPNGTATISGNTIIYTPDANYFGADTFTYVASDGQSNSGTGTVNVTVNSVNDAPNAVDDTASTTEITPVNINVIANDTDIEGNALTVTSVTQPANGAVANIGNGTVTYTAHLGFTGTDTFTYTISDGNGGTSTATVTVTVNQAANHLTVNDNIVTTNEDQPIAINVLTNDVDTGGHLLTITNIGNTGHGSTAVTGGTITYTPAANYFGADTFTYSVSDGHGNVGTANVILTITSVNDAPLAVNDNASTVEITPVIN